MKNIKDYVMRIKNGQIKLEPIDITKANKNKSKEIRRILNGKNKK